MITPTGVAPELNEWLLCKAAWPIQAFAGVDEQWPRESVDAFAEAIAGTELLFYRDVMSEQHFQLTASGAPGEIGRSPAAAAPESSLFIVEIDHDGDELDALLWLVGESDRLRREGRSVMTLVDLLMHHYRHEVAAGAPRQTLLNYRRVIESFSRWLGRPATIADLTATNVSSFTEHLLAETTVCRPTFQMHRVQISQLASYAKRRGWLQRS